MAGIIFNLNNKNMKMNTLANETLLGLIPSQDIPDVRKSLREMMDAHFLQFGGEGSDPAYSAFLSMDALLESLIEYHQQKEELVVK